MACKRLRRFRFYVGSNKALRTEQELVLVNNIGDSEIESSKDHDLGLNNTICDGNHEHEYSLWIYSSVVDHRWSVEFSKVWTLNQ